MLKDMQIYSTLKQDHRKRVNRPSCKGAKVQGKCIHPLVCKCRIWANSRGTTNRFLPDAPWRAAQVIPSARTVPRAAVGDAIVWVCVQIRASCVRSVVCYVSLEQHVSVR